MSELRRCEKGLLRAWLYELDLPTLSGGVLTIVARNDAQLRHLERSRGAIARAAQVALGRLVSVDLQARPEDAVTPGSVNDLSRSGLRPDFTLDLFVVAPENHLAHGAALRFLNEPGITYSPLFLHGPIGAGKSHLLQAVCQNAMAQSGPPSFPVGTGEGQGALYMTAERFIAQFTECIEAGSVQHFRRQFLEADPVVLDDVEFFAGKSRSQEELFHVVNGVLAGGRRLLLGADRPPAAISGIEERLASRFSGGLVVAMDCPTAETRLRIIEQKDRMGCFEFPKEALRQIAERCAPRDLDRALSRLDALAQNHGGQLSMDLVDEVFRSQTHEAVIA